MNLITPLAYIGLGLVALFGLYMAGRVLFRAYFKSKLEYDQQRRKDDEPV
jgi:hypothetical protein